jgi:phosphopantothenoylcysteine decarboxylase/phosphopantothenate--cysteine ligase
LDTKKILITAGPTWVALDKVRVISNISTGKTGIVLAEKLNRLGCRVTLILGPVEACCINKQIKLVRFNYFEELKKIIIREVSSKKYDVFIHCAAVSDYKPKRVYSDKIKSGIRNLVINLVPTEKLIDLIRRLDNSIFLAGFKFEPQANKAKLIKSAKTLAKRSKVDLVVANSLDENFYQAFVISKDKISKLCSSREAMAKELIETIAGKLKIGKL